VAWQDYQHRRASAEQVHAWFTRRPDADVGIVTGAVSGLVVLDVDPSHGGTRSLAVLERQHGPLPLTVEAVSGGGGRHLYFAHPGGLVRNRAGLAPGIDLRGDGGMIVAPPSAHPSGAHYAWHTGQGPDEIDLAPLPRWLLGAAPPGTPRAEHPLEHWRRLLAETLPQGKRNSTLASMSGRLLWYGVDPGLVTELLLCWNLARCHPPLPDDEVVRTVQSISRLYEREEQREREP
jgi:hypothetical protein